MASSSPATAASPGPSALEALRAKFPNPLHLKGLSFLDFMDFTPAEKQADNWYIPSFNLLVELQRIPNDLIRDRDGQPEFIKENMDSTYSALVNAPELPDIVQEVLLQAHRRIVANAEWEKRVAREKEQIRQQRLTALQKKPILLFDERLNVLPQYREFFPPEVIALEGVRAAMLKCHRDALRAMHQLAVNEAKPDPTRIVSPQAATDRPIEQTPKPPEAEDDGWDLILGAAHAGRKGGKGK